MKQKVKIPTGFKRLYLGQKLKNGAIFRSRPDSDYMSVWPEWSELNSSTGIRLRPVDIKCCIYCNKI